MSLRAKIIKNTGLHFFGRMISTALGVVAVGLLTRHLGTEGYGEYTIATAFPQFFSIIADFGLTLTTITLLSEKSEAEAPRLFANLIGLRIVSSIVFFGLVPIVVFFFPFSDTVKIGAGIGALAYAILSLNQMLLGVFQRYLAMQQAALAEVVGRAMLVAFMAAAAFSGSGVVAMIWAMVGANIIQFLLLFAASRRFIPMDIAFDLAVWRAIILRAWPLGLSIVCNLVYLKGDVLFLSLLRSKEEVGIYGATYKVLDVLTFIPMAFMGLVLPILSKTWAEGGRERFHGYLQKSFDALTFLALPLPIGGYFIAAPLMRLVGGSDFGSGGPILAILLLALTAVFFSGLFGHTVVALQKQRMMLWGYLAAALLSIPAYYFAIQRYGGTGAAWVTVFSEVLVAVLTFVVVARASGFLPKLDFFAKSAAACLVMGLLMFQFQLLPWPALFLLGCVSYFLTAWSLGILPRKLLQELRGTETV